MSGKAWELIWGYNLGAKNPCLNQLLNHANSVKSDNWNRLIFSLLLIFPSFIPGLFHITSQFICLDFTGMDAIYPLHSPFLLSFHPKWWHVVMAWKWMDWVVSYVGLHPSGTMVFHIFHSSLSLVWSLSLHWSSTASLSLPTFNYPSTIPTRPWLKEWYVWGLYVKSDNNRWEQEPSRKISSLRVGLGVIYLPSASPSLLLGT